jgi:hypothetical protein
MLEETQNTIQPIFLSDIFGYSFAKTLELNWILDYY